ncbi:hypothetical protein K456DRAFT_1844276, partial [Colletotrichum gloeosporioides 23]
ILQEENNLLSRHRRTKKTHLRQRGSLTIAEAEDIQSQREATTQIEEETRQKNRGSSKRRQTSLQHYGICRKTGHNARACPEAVEVSSLSDSE